MTEPKDIDSWVDLGDFWHVPETVLIVHADQLYQQWRAHSDDYGVRQAIKYRIQQLLAQVEIIEAGQRADLDDSGSSFQTVERYAQVAAGLRAPLTAAELAEVSTNAPEQDFDFWRDVIGDDLVIDGVAYSRREYRYAGEGWVELIPYDERPENQPIGQAFTRCYPALAAAAAEQTIRRHPATRHQPAARAAAAPPAPPPSIEL